MSCRDKHSGIIHWMENVKAWERRDCGKACCRGKSCFLIQIPGFCRVQEQQISNIKWLHSSVASRIGPACWILLTQKGNGVWFLCHSQSCLNEEGSLGEQHIPGKPVTYTAVKPFIQRQIMSCVHAILHPVDITVFRYGFLLQYGSSAGA